ncbi:DNA-methyltransferase [Methanoculleus bourgensis]|jgi:site-specific DNA-methyltransferase (adenine-specific)|nr:site-specific DNA-methyltransferase [Methanoculleus bourgensis]
MAGLIWTHPLTLIRPEETMRSVTINGNTFYNGDCVPGAEEHIPENTVDLIITDPPYGINGDRLHRHYNRDEGFVVEGYVEVPADEYGEFSRAWIRQAERILRPGGSLYIVSGYTNLYHILAALRETGLVEVNHIIWHYNFGVYTRRKYVSSHYHILYYEKPGGRRTFNLEARYGTDERDLGNGSLNYRDREDVWAINREYKPGRLKNKNELPTELLVKMMQYSSNEGDLVCDMFLGGFSTARVAIGLNRRVTGFEISEPVFAAKTAEIRATKPGYLLPGLRTPEKTGDPPNRGKPWTDAETSRLAVRFAELRDAGMTKKDTVAVLGQELGRGRWAIERMLKGLDTGG